MYPVEPKSVSYDTTETDKGISHPIALVEEIVPGFFAVCNSVNGEIFKTPIDDCKTLHNPSIKLIYRSKEKAEKVANYINKEQPISQPVRRNKK